MWKKILIGVGILMVGFLGVVVGFFSAIFLNTEVKGFGNVARLIGTLKFVETYYVQEVDEDKLVEGAISGMVNSLGDPHSLYLEPKLYSQLMAETSGSYGGIGVYMGFKDNSVYVLGVIPESPGAKAGLLAGDLIMAVDSVPIEEIEPAEVVMKIRGEIGTTVELLIHREGEDDKTYKIVRDAIKFKTVAGKMLDEREGYIRISNFSENSGKEFKAALNELESQNMKGLILDLRQNPGGVIDSCVEVAQEIVPAGTVVSVIRRDGDKEIYTSDLKAARFPIVVLIDENSASAAELLSGALQDKKAALIVGKKSYGKGSVQTVIPMFHDDGLKLTVAKYYTPNGRSIDGIGIVPDVEVELEIPLMSSREIEFGNFTDTQLEMAEELLAKQIDAGKILFDDKG